MKKFSILLFSLFLFVPFLVRAAENPNVLTLEASADGNTISYNGTMEDGSSAVMCKIYDSNNEEIDMLSSEVNDNSAFAGEFTVHANDEYKVSCANYEGGEIKSAEVTVGDIVMYSLTFDLNGGTAEDFEVPEEVEEGTVFELDEISEEDVTPPKGKVFDAYEINGTRYEVGDTYTVEGDTTVKLLWKDAPKGSAASPKTYDAGILVSVILLVVSVVAIICLLVFRNKKKR